MPKFITMGEAFGSFYAVTERAEGEFLDLLQIGLGALTCNAFLGDRGAAQSLANSISCVDPEGRDNPTSD